MFWLFFGIVATGMAITLALVIFMFGAAWVIVRVCDRIFRRCLHRRFTVIPLPRG